MIIKMTYVNTKYIVMPCKVTCSSNEQAASFVQECTDLFYLKLQINIINLISHNAQAPTHTLVKRKRKGGAKMRKLEYSFEQLDIFLDSQEAELTISIAMLTSLLKRELLTQQQYNECVAKLKQLYTD